MTWADMSLLLISERGQKFGEEESRVRVRDQGRAGHAGQAAEGKAGQRAAQGGIWGAQAFLPLGRDAYPPVSLKPWVAVATMEMPGPLQPRSAENVVGIVTLSAPPTTFIDFLAGINSTQWFQTRAWSW